MAINKQLNINMIVHVIMLLVCLDCGYMVESASLEGNVNEEEGKALNYLKNLGYIESNKYGASSLTPEAFKAAVIEYQEFFGLNQTGVADEETLEKMQLSRCGNPDKLKAGAIASNFISSIPKRRKRALEGQAKWGRVNLSYKIWNYPKLFSSVPNKVDYVIQNALNAWSAVTPFNFVKTNGQADINIKFAVKKHCDGGDFDGPSGTLAHAFFPEQGRVHFDDDENWTLDGIKKGFIDLYSVAVHEFGHTLGLEHKKDIRALMYPIYGATNRLSDIDISAIQKIYGGKTSAPEGPPAIPPRPRERRPNLCKDPSIDAITMSNTDKVFVFKGNWYWLLNDEADGILHGYPRPIAKDWIGLPGYIDAALTFTDGRMFFFKGDKYWRYTNRRLDVGYPMLISLGLPGVPDNIDGAFVWKEQKVFFFKGNHFWRFDARDPVKVKENYPAITIAEWKGVPPSISDVFRWKNGFTYFFKDEVYYKYNDDTDEVDMLADPPFPRPAAEWWYGCENNFMVGSLEGSGFSVGTGNETGEIALSADGIAIDSSDFPELEIKLSDFQATSNNTAEELNFSNIPSLDN